MVGTILGLGGKTEPRRSESSHNGKNSNTFHVPFPESPSSTHQSNPHFFALPLWRKRALPGFPTRTISEGPHTFAPRLTSQRTLRKGLLPQKDLSPMPSNSAPNLTNIGPTPKLDDRVGNTVVDGKIISGPTVPCSPYSRAGSRQSSKVDLSLSSSHSTTTLLHAALQVGLPPVIPRASISSARDIDSPSKTSNSLSFSRNLKPDLRHTKSCHSMRSNIRDPAQTTELGEIDGQRGVPFASSTTPAGNGDIPPSNTRSIFRRPSFWSNRKAEASPGPLKLKQRTPPSHPTPLPMVQTTSPLDMEFTFSAPPGDQAPRRPSGLTRHHSEISRKPALSSASVVPELPVVNTLGPRYSKCRRPKTADPSSPNPPCASKRPSTAGGDPSLCAPSLFDTRPAIAAPPRSRTHSAFQPSPSSDALPRMPKNNVSSFLSNDPHCRRRSTTNPPLLHRLSINILSPPRTKTNGSLDAAASPIANSPLPRTKPPIEIPKPRVEEESPREYLQRLIGVIGKAEVAGILASSGDAFYLNSLKLFMDQFNFSNDPLDVAVRKLLMEVVLPRETQQIDRVIEAFAKSYLRCNPDLFVSDDHPYILAFSLIMLHTDAFNKVNKRKMSKADYIKNTSLPGLAPEVLDCFYDNIVFAPFIFIEDALDINNALEGSSTPRILAPSSTHLASPAPPSGNTLFGRTKIDPYYLITRNLLGPLRVDVENLIPTENPYSYQGTTGPLNGEVLLHAFAQATVIEMGIIDSTRLPSAFFGLHGAGMPSPMLAGVGTMPEIPPSTGNVWTLKVTKVGLLNRKDEILEGGKRVSNRKWRPWSVLLTKSQLLLFRDSSWAAALLTHSIPSGSQVRFPQTSIFKPDELFSIKDAVAVYDKSYTYANAFRLVLADGRHIMFQTADEKELNEWISRINYASTFRSTGVRMRSLGMSGKDVELTGVAAANSHLHDLQRQHQQVHAKVHSWSAQNPSHGHAPPYISAGVDGVRKRMPPRRVTMMSARHDVDLEIPVDPGIEGAYQFKATFDQVKAELAAGYWYSSASRIVCEPGSRPISEFSISSPPSTSSEGDAPPVSTRSQIIKPKVDELESKIAVTISQLDSDMRFIRNVAIMTPFQKATRDRLQDAIQNVSKKTTQLRLDMARMICHRNVLLNDLAEEERRFYQTKTLALQAAAETLQSSSAQNVLRLSSDGESSPALVPHPRDQKRGTFMSTSLDLDLGLDWSSSVEDMAALNLLDSSLEAESPMTEYCSFTGHIFPDASPAGRKPGPLDPTPLVELNGRDSQVEQAEEWDKTRAAKRVSLVRLPSDFRVPTMLGKQHRGLEGEDGISTVIEGVVSD